MQEHSYGGTGAPGKTLEALLGLDGGNQDTPDAGKWEIKFHSGNALLTLFHLEAQPRGHMHDMVRRFGLQDTKGRISFRHTIRGRSEKGFNVTNRDNRILICHDSFDEDGGICPFWTHDSILNAFASKFRRLIVVKGRKRKNLVRYDTAHLYWEPRSTLFIDAVVSGIVAVDFDARTGEGRGLRNLYQKHEDFE